jgi:hypothetical protein
VNRILVMCFLFVFLISCSSNIDNDMQVRYIDAPMQLNHPIISMPPENPNVRVLVLTDETIEHTKAYIGFEYNEWLLFAKWLQNYKIYNKDLRKGLDVYKLQDETLSSE